MKRTTKQILGILTASALAAGFATSADARGWYGPGCYGAGPGMSSGMMRGPGGRMGGPGGPMGVVDPAATAQRLDQLKAGLGITADQEGAWKDFAQAMTNRAALRSGHRQARFSGALTPEEMQELRQTGMAQRQQMLEARQALYAVLTPEQRAQAGQLIWRRGGRW